MHAVRANHRWGLVAVTLALSVAGCEPVTESDMGREEALEAPPTSEAFFRYSPNVFRVFTRNIYLGGDTGPLFTLDFTDTPAVVAGAAAFWGQVQASNFPDRAKTIADEIARTNPHVVGLQEVARYVLLDGDFHPTEGLDMLQILQSELAAEGLSYDVVLVQKNTSGSLPLSIDFVAPGSPAPDQYLQFTLREVTLVRRDLNVVDQSSANYLAELDLGPLVLKRGWSRVTVDFRGVPFHVVNTHLETQSVRPVHDAQAAELLETVTAGLEGVTIVMGDLNSDAEGQPGEPSWTPTYDLLTSNGFNDAWNSRLFRRFGGEGFTCCHDPDLMNGRSELDERIDFVLVRTALEPLIGDGLPGLVAMSILGDDQRERTATELWPADHAALFAGLRLPYRRLRSD